MTTSSWDRNGLRMARALTARSIREVAEASKVDYWTIADFEQGYRNSLGEHADAIERAMAGFGAIFALDGTITTAKPPTSPLLDKGDPLRWIESEDLANWGPTRDGQEHGPELIGRLILGTVGPAADFRFPAGDSVLFAGWDGICSIEAGAGKVPDGVSVWEMGGQRLKVREKAEGDYKKRSKGATTIDRKDTTYVCVTPQRWPKKENWRKAKIAEEIWKDVRVIDGDDLVHWLDLCPGAARWLAVRLGKRRTDLREIRQAFDEWSLATEPRLSADLLLSDRDDQATQIRRWLAGQPAVFPLPAESAEEATAFLRAVLEPLPPLHRAYREDLMFVAESKEAARSCIGLSAKLVVVLMDADPGLAKSLERDGHHVFMALGAETVARPDVPRLARPWKLTIRIALERMNIDPQKAQVLASGCGRSLTVLRRLMQTGPDRKPSWSVAPVSTSLIAAMLAGGWDGANPVDRDIMERLGGRRYEDIESDLTAFASFDGPLRRSGSMWKLASLRDIWPLLADQLTSRHLDLLTDDFLKVFSTDNPAFDAPAENAWLPSNKPPSVASTLLRHGLTETLIALAVFPGLLQGVPDAAYRSRAAVRKLLEGADERRWWSLSDDYRLLAEASPEALLDALEEGLRANPTPIMPLFRSDEGFVHRVEYLADLMWAMEILAWNPDYLGRVAMLLARLAELDPGGTFSNRPNQTLRTIFLPISPRTFASHAARMEVLDAIIRRFPKVGWKLLVDLAPDIHPLFDSSAAPSWRDFPAEASPRVVTVSEDYRHVGGLMIAEVGNDLKRWSDVFDNWNAFDGTWREEALRALTDATDAASPEDRNAFREMLRRLIGKHQQFPDAHWTMKADVLAPLKALYERLEPTDAIERLGWLFGSPDYKFRSDRSWLELEREAEEARHAAAEEILATATPDAVIAMAKTVRNARLLGDAVAAAAISDETKNDFFEQALYDPTLEDFLRGLVTRIGFTRDESWLRERLEQGVERKEDADLLSRIGLLLSHEKRNWEAIERADADVAMRYWKRMNAFAPGAKDDPEYVVGKLLAAGNGHAAMSWIAAYPAMPVSTALIASVLRHPSTLDMSGVHDGGMFQHEAIELFKRLDADASFSRQEIAQLEWIYYRALEHGSRPAKWLDEAIAGDPGFFVHLLSMFYSADVPSSPSESERNMARQAYRVLNGWSVVPGTKADGEIDGERLRSWVDEVLRLAKEKRLSDVAESKIGAILARAPEKGGLPWPPQAVRQLIEHVGSKELENGFFVAERNKHGSSMRRMTEGGSIERSVASRYRDLAKAAGTADVRTRGLLIKLAESYEREAEEEDRSAERRDW